MKKNRSPNELVNAVSIKMWRRLRRNDISGISNTAIV